MLHENFVYLAVLINIIGGFSYLLDTLKGRVKPNRVTWFIWALAPLIAFVAEIKQGVGVQSLLTFIIGFNPLIIFLATFLNKKSVWKISKLDLICGGLSLIGLGFWFITRNGNFAIIFSLMADGLAAIPTIVKTYYFPQTESPTIYIAAAIAAVLTLLTIKEWNIAHYGFPVSAFLIPVIILVILKFRSTQTSSL